MDEKGTTADRTTPVLIADDHALFRYGMRAMLGAAAGYEVVACQTSGFTAWHVHSVFAYGQNSTFQKWSRGDSNP
jgi:hypothetical protein